MIGVKRSELIELLGQLGAENSEEALEAARTLHRQISEAELAWDDLLRSETDVVFGGTGAADEETVETDSEPAAPAIAAPDMAEAARLIDRLLARTTISESLREELGEFKSNIAKGEFDAMDARYLSALANRLGA
jgi:hypothetical protein